LNPICIYTKRRSGKQAAFSFSGEHGWQLDQAQGVGLVPARPIQSRDEDNDEGAEPHEKEMRRKQNQTLSARCSFESGNDFGRKCFWEDQSLGDESARG
jgi:hypothetical protein